MEDYLKNSLREGDKVIVIHGGEHTLRRGKVVGFTSKKIRVEIYTHDGHHWVSGYRVLKFPQQIVKKGW